MAASTSAEGDARVCTLDGQKAQKRIQIFPTLVRLSSMSRRLGGGAIIGLGTQDNIEADDSQGKRG